MKWPASSEPMISPARPCETSAPGPLPLPPAAFDIVGSRDSISRIPDKHALKAVVFGVLRPGGALSDNSTKISPPPVHLGTNTPPGVWGV